MSGRIVNIHHSFLLSFKGANSYKQAFERAVTFIRATFLYATADHDEEPTIQQDITRITHAKRVSDYVMLGRDFKAQVLAGAVHAHAQHPVFHKQGKDCVISR